MNMIEQSVHATERNCIHLNIVTFNRKAGKELTMRCLTVTTFTTPTTEAITATLTQEGLSTTNQVSLAL